MDSKKQIIGRIRRNQYYQNFFGSTGLVLDITKEYIGTEKEQALIEVIEKGILANILMSAQMAENRLINEHQCKIIKNQALIAVIISEQNIESLGNLSIKQLEVVYSKVKHVKSYLEYIELRVSNAVDMVNEGIKSIKNKALMDILYLEKQHKKNGEHSWGKVVISKALSMKNSTSAIVRKRISETGSFDIIYVKPRTKELAKGIVGIGNDFSISREGEKVYLELKLRKAYNIFKQKSITVDYSLHYMSENESWVSERTNVKAVVSSNSIIIRHS